MSIKIAKIVYPFLADDIHVKETQMGAGFNAFESKMSAKAIPWQNIIAIIQAIVAMLTSGICPVPANKAGLQRAAKRRAALILRYRREMQGDVDFATARDHVEAAAQVMDESTEEECQAFIHDCCS